MILRSATPDDAPALAQLYDLVWSQEIGILGEKLTRERCADAQEIRGWLEKDRYFVIEVEAGIVAVIGCEARHGTLHLVHLVVHPDHRRQGHARRLMEEAEKFAQQIGAIKIWFDTASGLQAAMDMYEALGYQQCGYFKRHYWGTDLILYEKILPGRVEVPST